MRVSRWLRVVMVLLPGILQAGPLSSEPPPDLSEQRMPAPQTAEAKAVVAKLNQTLLEVMRRARELGYSGRYRLLQPVVTEVYDFVSISRYVLGSHWRQLSPEDKKIFVQKMIEFGIAAYAAEFNDYSGEQFKILSEEPFRNKLRVVKAVLESPKEPSVQFVYILKPAPGGWKIIDVRYDGVSDLALKRAQFSDILVKEGFARLLAKLDERIANYAKGMVEEETNTKARRKTLGSTRSAPLRPSP
ncbi:MAG: ABC transporter substrate-binding protein [Methylohalobius sp.]|nr:ABC transporter substrate-binding protein [Methylohalobius sp.]